MCIGLSCNKILFLKEWLFVYFKFFLYVIMVFFGIILSLWVMYFFYILLEMFINLLYLYFICVFYLYILFVYFICVFCLCILYVYFILYWNKLIYLKIATCFATRLTIKGRERALRISFFLDPYTTSAI